MKRPKRKSEESKMSVTVTLCTQVMKYYGPTQDLYALYIAMCVLNAVFSVTAVAGNLLLLLALRKTTSLPETSRILLQSLAFSDFVVGLLAHPLYIALTLQVLNNYRCETFHQLLTAFFLISCTLSAVSLLTVTSVGVDRFLAISLHLRYHELVTPRRVRLYVVVVWTFVLLLVQTVLFINLEFGEFALLIFGFASMLIVSIVYIKIYVISRHHQVSIDNQAQAVAVDRVQAGNHNMVRNKRLAMKTFYAFVVFLLCYLPYLVTITFIVVTGTNVRLQAVIQLTTLLLLLNSSLNPVVFGWKMKEIRQVAGSEIRWLFCRP